MNPIRLTLLIGAAALLAACATTPEQKAARAQAQKRYEQDLQVHLAAQCDQETAALLSLLRRLGLSVWPLSLVVVRY